MIKKIKIKFLRHNNHILSAQYSHVITLLNSPDTDYFRHCRKFYWRALLSTGQTYLRICNRKYIYGLKHKT